VRLRRTTKELSREKVKGRGELTYKRGNRLKI